MLATGHRRARALQSVASVIALLLALGASAAWAAEPSTQPGQANDQSGVSNQPNDRAKSRREGAAAVSELVVTGTNVRGGVVTGPLKTVTREDIQLGGFTDVSQAIGDLSVNFGGGVNRETFNTGDQVDNANFNNSFASSADLRGLGSNATLVLLDGRRLPVGGLGVSVDLSLIPLGFVDRIDVLADGASAIYGSDAIGGVVNLITRHDFDGYETRLNYGSGRGGPQNFHASQLAGFNWTGGNLEIGYQYDDLGRLPYAARKQTQIDSYPNDAIPQEYINSVFVDGAQDITPSLSAFVQGLYSDRSIYLDENGLVLPAVSLAHIRGDTSGAGITAGLRFEPPGSSWRIEAFGDYARDLFLDKVAFGSGAYTPSRFVETMPSAEVRVTGEVAKLPGGPVGAFFGLSYRSEDYFTSGAPSPNQDSRRDVEAVSAEFDAPIVGASNAKAWLRQADIVIAGRYDHYSDFGNTVNPKIGFSLVPFDGVRLHGDYSTSFRAPAGFEETTLPDFASGFIRSVPDPLSPTGHSLTFYKTDGNPNLKPETARNYTIGLEFEPPAIPGLKLTIDYYDIAYRNRIANPDPSRSGLFSLAAPAIQGLINRSPTLAEVQQLFNTSPLVFNFLTGSFGVGSTNPASIQVIVDASYRNLAATRTNGMDLDASYRRVTALGEWTFSFSGTYIFDLSNQLRAGAPYLSVLNTVQHPADFKARGGVAWRRDGWTAATFVNYVNNYEDTRNPAMVLPVGSWTTVDAHLGYQFKDHLALAGDGSTTISVNASNLFDVGPPLIKAIGRGFTYDSANASIVGRFVSVELVKKW